MSPALVKKYLAANQNIADHLLLLPEGFTFAPFPVLTDTDRDKYCVRRIVDFYQQRPTNLADYFQAAWQYHHRVKLGQPKATLADCAKAARVVRNTWRPSGRRSPIRLRTTGRLRPCKRCGVTCLHPIRGRTTCAPRAREMRDFVVQLRDKVKVKVENLTVREMNRGAQALVLWKDHQTATKRRTYGGGAVQIKASEFGLGDAAAKALAVPTDAKDRERYEATFKQFCSVFPDAFYISERGRVFLDPKEDRFNTGRLLSAGFHNQMGYFRDDQPLCELILDDTAKKTLDTLWQEFDFASNVPSSCTPASSGSSARNRSSSAARNSISPVPRTRMLPRQRSSRSSSRSIFQKTRKSTNNETIIKAVQDHFECSEANIRWVERRARQRKPAMSRHCKTSPSVRIASG